MIWDEIRYIGCMHTCIAYIIVHTYIILLYTLLLTKSFNVYLFAATVPEKARDDDVVCQITSERLQEPLQRHLSLYVVTPQNHCFILSTETSLPVRSHLPKSLFHTVYRDISPSM